MTSRQQLAIDGGVPVRREPVAPWPHYAEDEIAAAADVLRSGGVNYWTGDTVKEFERAYADSLGVSHAIAVANGTVALEIALRALGVGAGDDVIVTSRTFVASASCIVSVGARPVFADVDRASQNITVDSIEAVLTPRTRAIIAVHLAGWPCDMDGIMALARSRGIRVIEDCAQAHGAVYKGRPMGAFGDVAAFSFCQDKIISTGGEGGLLVTDDEALWRRSWSFKDHGKNPARITDKPPGVEFRWLHDTIGTNLRMTAMQAAIGLCQLQKLTEWTAQRNANARALRVKFESVPGLRVPIWDDDVIHACYKFYAFVRPNMLQSGWTRNRILEALRAEGVPASTGTCSEVYLEKAFDDPGVRPVGRLPVARELGETSVMLPIHPTLTAEDVDDMAAAFAKVMAEAANS